MINSIYKGCPKKLLLGIFRKDWMVISKLFLYSTVTFLINDLECYFPFLNNVDIKTYFRIQKESFLKILKGKSFWNVM